jgi:hypothetical protein
MMFNTPDHCREIRGTRKVKPAAMLVDTFQLAKNIYPLFLAEPDDWIRVIFYRREYKVRPFDLTRLVQETLVNKVEKSISVVGCGVVGCGYEVSCRYKK